MNDLKHYKSLLPDQITVETKITEEGLVAEIKDFPMNPLAVTSIQRL